MPDVDLKAEIRWWLAILRTADRLHEELPEAMRQEIEAGACERELGRMATHMAGMSESTRRNCERVLTVILDELGEPEVSSLDEPFLRIVGRAAF